MTGAAGLGSDLQVTSSNLGAVVKGFEDTFLLKVGSTQSTSVTLVGPTSAISAGQPTQLTASVTGTTSGNVTFSAGTLVLATQALVGSTATLNTSSLPVGTSNVVAVYDGDNTHDGSSSAPVTITVAKAKPSATLDMSSTDPDPGDSVTATVTVKGGFNPTGVVTFRVDGEIRFTSVLTSTGPDSGTASGNFTPEGKGLASGNFEATYEGDDNNEAATTNSIRVTTNSGILGGLGGGGCTIGDDSRDVTLPILLLLALWGLWCIRRRGV